MRFALGLWLLLEVSLFGVSGWKLDSSTYITPWAKEFSLQNVQCEYPRPTLVRSNWLSLNGIWGYAITSYHETNQPDFTNQILVPFPVESVLAGTHQVLTEFQRLWYRRTFTIPPNWRGMRVWLHFEAVDWETRIRINGHELGIHRGGYDRFSYDLTDFLKPDKKQELIVSVYDPNDSGSQPRGKQMLNPKPPFCHASSGIWQTVWLEPLGPASIESLKLVPDIDHRTLNVSATGIGDTNNTTLEAIAYDGMIEVARSFGRIGKPLSLSIPQARMWSSSDPFLYDLKVTLRRGDQVMDEVRSYFGMRKISIAKSTDGYPRLMLNNKGVFQLGVLDQGYWPDGICTAPNDAALRSDVELIKLLGFNLARKHVKIEPERWYYWCDVMGVLVWQDMPNGDRSAQPKEGEIQRSSESSAQFETELKQMISDRGNHPCIVMWIAFNQGWGQYDTARIISEIKTLDPSRLVIGASGWNDLGLGDVRSLHQYPGPAAPEHDGHRPCVIGECGGLGLSVTNHEWGPMSHWNTTAFGNAAQLEQGYDSLLAKITIAGMKAGLSGAVISELTDVESEQDGFVTYDRSIIKMPIEQIRAANQKVLEALSNGSFK